jgi:hypothetical protein
MARVLTGTAIVETEFNNRVRVRPCWARLGDTVADAVSKINVGAEADHINLAVLGWAAELGG